MAAPALHCNICSTCIALPNLQAQLVTAVATLMDGSGATSSRSSQGPTVADTYLTLDPKQEAGRGGSATSSAGVPGAAREAIVFMVGGGNYLERERLTQWAEQAAPKRRVLYGATELLSGQQFCEQLALLGQKSGAVQ